MSCDIGKATNVWRMNCDVGEVTEMLENELCYDYNYDLCSFSNFSVTSPTSQLILQTFSRFTYVTAHSTTLPLLHLRQSSFFNPSFASPTSPVLHLSHLASGPCLWFFFFFLGVLHSALGAPCPFLHVLSTVEYEMMVFRQFYGDACSNSYVRWYVET